MHREAQERALPKETTLKLLIEVPTNLQLNAKPSIGKMKFFETRKKIHKKGNYTLNNPQQSHYV